MLVKISPLKELKIKVSSHIIEKIDNLAKKAHNLGYALDLNTTLGKFIENEIKKLDKQLDNEAQKPSTKQKS